MSAEDLRLMRSARKRGTMLRCTGPIWNCAKVVIVDSGFCVTKGLAELRKKELFGAALVKKHRYIGRLISRVMHLMPTLIRRRLVNVDAVKRAEYGVAHHVCCTKEPDCVHITDGRSVI